MVEKAIKVLKSDKVRQHEELMCISFASLISADNDELTEETKQELISRYTEQRKNDTIDWDYIIEPVYSDKIFEEKTNKAKQAAIERETI